MSPSPPSSSPPSSELSGVVVTLACAVLLVTASTVAGGFVSLAAPTDGSPFTVFNFRRESGTPAGSSWRMIATTGDDSVGVIPGGQSGVYYSSHYRDQLETWREGEYRPIPFEVTGRTTIVFREGDGGGDGS